MLPRLPQFFPFFLKDNICKHFLVPLPCNCKIAVISVFFVLGFSAPPYTFTPPPISTDRGEELALFVFFEESIGYSCENFSFFDGVSYPSRA